jgi:hypothetical protein
LQMIMQASARLSWSCWRKSIASSSAFTETRTSSSSVHECNLGYKENNGTMK